MQTRAPQTRPDHVFAVIAGRLGNTHGNIRWDNRGKEAKLLLKSSREGLGVQPALRFMRVRKSRRYSGQPI